jgi:hypothetical protein
MVSPQSFAASVPRHDALQADAVARVCAGLPDPDFDLLGGHKAGAEHAADAFAASIAMESST